jgi:uncharacterized membrane protein YccF (DUF307 family)
MILNIIWLIFCSWWMAILHVLAGILCAILIITIPFAIECFRISAYVMWPFGRSITVRRSVGIALCVTIIGIPLGLADFKMIPISLLPLGCKIVRSDELYVGPILKGRNLQVRANESSGPRTSTASRAL